MRPEKIRGNLFVANLPLGFTDEQLAELFDPYGIVIRAYLVRDPVTGETRGHGLVELAPDRVIDAAIAGVSAEPVGGRRVDARRADPEMSITPPTRPREQARPRLNYADRGTARPGPLVIEHKTDRLSRSAGYTVLNLADRPLRTRA